MLENKPFNLFNSYKFLIIIFLIFSSCSNSKKLGLDSNKNEIILINEGPWKTNFKNLVFNNIMYKLYGNDCAKYCLSKDASVSANADWINYDTVYINKATLISNKFVQDLESYDRDIEGIPVNLNYIIEYRLSKELDSITGVYYEQYKKDSLKSGLN